MQYQHYRNNDNARVSKKHGYADAKAKHDSKVKHKIDDRKGIRCNKGVNVCNKNIDSLTRLILFFDELFSSFWRRKKVRREENSASEV
jgi:hypothetical protein